MKKSIFAALISLSCIIFVFTSEALAADYLITLDEHDRDVSCYFNNTGGNRRAQGVNEKDIVWDKQSSYTVTIPSGVTHGGMSHGLIGHIDAKIPLDFNAIFGSYIKPEYQGRIVEAQIVVDGAAITSPNAILKCELKKTDGTVFAWT